jgi:hypothetical protein
MPQARRSGSGARSSSSRSQSKRSSSSSSGTRARSTRSTGTRARSTRSTTSARTSRSRTATGATQERADAVAQRLRKLNERIIEAGRDAGETTLASYERALKAIASAIERGPGSSEIEWVSSLASAQAKFIRDVTNAWTSAARERLK